MSRSLMRAIAVTIAALRWIGKGDAIASLGQGSRPESILKDAQQYLDWIHG